MNLTTERLQLRPLAIEHASFILNLTNTEGWLKNIGDRNIHSIEDAENYLNKNYILHHEIHGFGFCAVHLKSDDTPIGTCGIMKREGLEDIDIGFALLPAYAKKGYAFEAATAVMEYAKQELKLKKVVAITVKSNQSSRRLLEKIGLSFEKITYLPNDNEPLCLYAKTF